MASGATKTRRAGMVTYAGAILEALNGGTLPPDPEYLGVPRGDARAVRTIVENILAAVTTPANA